MKPSTIPVICGVALTVMSAAGLSHWWSVRQFADAVHQGLPIQRPTPSRAVPVPAAKPKAPPTLASSDVKSQQGPTYTQPQKEFFEALLKEVKTLRNENLNLVDQMAETNRDLMKLEFRVDTHSESFRPLPVNDERQDTSFDDGPGVLPPRAEPVFPFYDE
ncbi:MAG: hypothetical protein WEB53_05490 [Akkermansiaceae bacterium]